MHLLSIGITEGPSNAGKEKLLWSGFISVVDTGWLRKEYHDRLLQCWGHGTPLLVDYPVCITMIYDPETFVEGSG